MSVASDDLLLEIFIRLPDTRPTVRCRPVCKHWLSLVSQPQFICNFTRRHKGPQFPNLPYKFLFDRFNTRDISKKYHELSLDKPNNNPHRKPETCLRFLAWPVGHNLVSGLSASLDDLLVLSCNLGEYHIYNPPTGQLVALPQAPTNSWARCALVFDPNGCSKSIQCNCPAIRFRVMLIWWPRIGPVYGPTFIVSIYCSESGQWTKPLDTSLPCDFYGAQSWHYQSVVSNGFAYWLIGDDVVTMKGIAAFDPFKDTDHPQRCCFVQMPVSFGRGWRCQLEYLRLGVVQGQLRLSHFYLGLKIPTLP